jgi:hypothetical protein
VTRDVSGVKPEATTNSDAIAWLLRPLAARVVVSNPRKPELFAEAKVKTDKVDAASRSTSCWSSEWPGGGRVRPQRKLASEDLSE